RATTKYVVDGQQRSLALLAFYRNELRLSRQIELTDAAGLTYEQLPPNLQGNFLSYLLEFDQFETGNEEDVREYFRRINSFTAPLNAEEQRHARFQGPMKWFVHQLTERYGETFVNLGVLPKQSVVRMGDAKFIAEIVHALLNGVTTTSKGKLDAMYKDFDRGDEVPDAARLRAVIEDAIETILQWEAVPGSAIVRTNVFYSLMLAVILVRKRWQTLISLVPQLPRGGITQTAQENVLRLAAALSEPDVFSDYRHFTAAAAEKTNVKAQRETRIQWFVRALTERSI
ncbi:MAG TPA: hypothetical protein VGK54_04590, partial [Chloroflexota bacterium]